jgi:hypothetical protein
MNDFDDALVQRNAAGLPDRFFDRFVFNLHPPDATSPSLLFGLGVYPGSDTIDGFVILVTESEQRNLRFSTELSSTDGASAGPFSWRIIEPMAAWHVRLASNPINVTFDLRWQARAPAWFGEIEVAGPGITTAFDHLFQSGRYAGTVSIDHDAREISGWYGQRDRSRGVRTMAGGQGLHIWLQAQFHDRSVGLLLVETRDHTQLLLRGAVMHTTGAVDGILAVEHDLEFDTELDLIGGRVVVSTEAGRTYVLGVDARAGGGYMAGGGYGGHHGRPMGRDHVEHDAYPLDGSVSPRTLDTSLTDRLAVFEWDGRRGLGIFEFALSRSKAYTYAPTAKS